MNEPIENYALLGLNHHQLYRRSLYDPVYHIDTLKKVVKRDDLEILDLALPYGSYREQAVEILKNIDKKIIYNTPTLPFTSLSPSSLNPTEREQMLILMKDQIDAAYMVEADFFLLVSGPDPGIELRKEAYQIFHAFLIEVCEYLKSKGDMGLLIEHFDRDLSVKYLCGPSHELVELVTKLKNDGFDVYIELDFAHVPAIGESFKYAIETCLPYLKHVHLGNCIIDHPDHPMFGDQHPPIGFPDSRIGINELTEILQLLSKNNYLNQEKRGMLTLEIRPYPDKDEIESVNINMKMIHEAWGKA